MKNLLVLPVFLFSFSTSIFSQGEFTWDQSKKCRVFTSFNIPKGTFTHSGGVCKDGYLNGKASVRLFDNNVLWASITGTFEAGYLTGKGEILWERGDKFSGDFVKGKRTYGVFTYKSGLIYTGS
ncbi:MAG TPA: hypothetical protein VN451_03080, partial [Chitinophagaceae bacterium]|nr:hypothetical protein [Chitinophagaceae bacterium]